MKTSLCPSCDQKKYSAAKSRDGLCDECGGRTRSAERTAPTSDQRLTFRATFSVDLMKFCHPLFGFDVVKFDSHLKVPDGTSTADFILKKHGQGAVDLVRALIANTGL